MNIVVMVGNLTKDPEVMTKGEVTICKFNIAVQRRFKKDEADFFNCVAFGKTAEFISKYFTKGRKIAINGEVENNNYTDKEGVKHYGTQIVVGNAEFCDKKGETSEKTDDFMQVPDDVADEIPFR